MSTFHQNDQKIVKDIVSDVHLTTFVNILPTLRYSEGRNYIQIGKNIILYFCFPDGPTKDSAIFDFYKGGILEKQGLI